MNWNKIIMSVALIIVGANIATARPQQSNTPTERLFDLSSLFNRYPSYQRPIYGGNGFYQGQGGYYSGYNPQGGIGGGFGSYYPGSNGLGGGLGTNILGGSYGGSAGNFGGYGGYGGNGGLQQYGGYNNNNYNGQRNLGFGYYRGTDQYGFLPSREMNYITGTGYRGYN